MKDDDDRKLRIIALSFVVSNKIIEKKVLEKMWEVVRAMDLKILVTQTPKTTI
jgi:hypothetical protein